RHRAAGGTAAARDRGMGAMAPHRNLRTGSYHAGTPTSAADSPPDERDDAMTISLPTAVSTAKGSLIRAATIVQQDGPPALVQRMAGVADPRSRAWGLDEAVPDADIEDSATLRLAEPSVRPTPGRPLTIGWVTTPPGAGSGGHTTLL